MSHTVHVHLLQGRSREAVAVCQAGLRQALETGRERLPAVRMLESGLADVLLARTISRKSERHARHVHELGRRSGFYSGAMCGRADVGAGGAGAR